MALETGQTLSHYRLVEKIGEHLPTPRAAIPACLPLPAFRRLGPAVGVSTWPCVPIKRLPITAS